MLLDGAAQEPACVDLPRPDIAATFKTPESLLSGYWGFLDLSELPPDHARARITIVVRSTDDTSYVLGERVFELEPPPVPATSAALPHRRDRSGRRGLRRLLAVPHRHGRRRLRRLLVVTHSLQPGGSERLLMNVLVHLAEVRGVQGAVVSVTDGPLRQPLEAAGFIVRVADDFRVDSDDGYEARQHQLLAWAERQRFDLVLANALNSFPGIDLGVRLGLPTVWKINEAHPLSTYWDIAFPPGAVADEVRTRARRAVNAATVLMVPSTSRDGYAGPGRRVVPIAPGIDLEEVRAFRTAARRDDLRRRLGLPRGSRVLLVLGTVAPHKMQTLCARAFAAASAHDGSAILAIVGAGPDRYSEGLRSYVDAAGVGDRIRVVPRSPERLAWLEASDAVVCPSQYEGLPLVVLEAMAFERPVVASAVGEIPTIIRPGQTGLLVAPCDLVALRDGLEQVLALSALERETMGRAGAAIVRADYGLANYLDAFTRAVDEALEARRN